MNIGSSNRPIYDTCETEYKIYEATSPYAYRTNQTAYENCNKCIGPDGRFYTPYDLVDIETELKNITRPLSKCAQFKYNPACKRSGLCLSTFDRTIPKPVLPDVCPIVYNNILRQTNPGYHLPRRNFCGQLAI